MPSIVKGFFADPSEHLEDFRPSGFRSGGMTGSLVPGGTKGEGVYSVARTDTADTALRGVQSALRGKASEFQGLRQTVAPGFGEVARTRIDAVRDARRRTVGDLRQELQKRRVLGGSFGQSQIAQTEAEFAKLEAQERAQSYLEELATTSALIDQEFGASVQAAQVELEQLNLESQIAANMSGMATNVMHANSIAKAEVDSALAAGSMQLYGTAMGMAAKALAGG